MGNLSEHFSAWEFKCPCSGCKHRKIHIDLNLVNKLEKIRTLIGNKPIDITSGVRCKAENNRVGGSRNSPHLLGKGADIQVEGLKPIEIALMAEPISDIRIGIYPNHVHIDVIPPNPSRFWLVKKYGQAPIYSGNENDLKKFLREEKII